MDTYFNEKELKDLYRLFYYNYRKKVIHSFKHSNFFQILNDKYPDYNIDENKLYLKPHDTLINQNLFVEHLKGKVSIKKDLELWLPFLIESKNNADYFTPKNFTKNTSAAYFNFIKKVLLKNNLLTEENILKYCDSSQYLNFVKQDLIKTNPEIVFSYLKDITISSTFKHIENIVSLSEHTNLEQRHITELERIHKFVNHAKIKYNIVELLNKLNFENHEISLKKSEQMIFKETEQTLYNYNIDIDPSVLKQKTDMSFFLLEKYVKLIRNHISDKVREKLNIYSSLGETSLKYETEDKKIIEQIKKIVQTYILNIDEIIYLAENHTVNTVNDIEIKFNEKLDILYNAIYLKESLNSSSKIDVKKLKI